MTTHQLIYDAIGAINLAALAYFIGWRNGRQATVKAVATRYEPTEETEEP